MAGKTIDYDIEYIEQGVVHKIPVKIFFVSHRVRRDYNSVVADMGRVQRLYDDITYNIASISALKTEKPKDWKDKVKEIEAENEQLALDINDIAESGVLERRNELVIKLLKDNGATDKRIFDPESWEEHIDPSQQIEILELALWKDLNTDKKKAV